MNGTMFFEEIAAKAPFSRLHPKVGSFFREYLGREKVIRFNDQYVVNTNFPPYPSGAFETLATHFSGIGTAGEARRLFSVTVAVTNRCGYACRHCYNAGRTQEDLPLAVWRDLAAKLQSMGAVLVTLTGGEPLLRGDLEAIAGCFDARSCLSLNTTGSGLTPARAAALKRAGLFGVGVSLDSTDPAEHDRFRGREGAFDRAVAAVGVAREAGLYPYVIAVANKALLEPARFWPFMAFAKEIGAAEVHLLEPCPVGNLFGQTELLLDDADRERIVAYQEQAARNEAMPVLSCFLYVEGADAFGCGAGLTHLYVDGGGEVCPCNLVPLSFGNIRRDSLECILDRMSEHFETPRCECAGKTLAAHIPEGKLVLSPEESAALCGVYLPREHALPKFFHVRQEAVEIIGTPELEAAYNEIHADYDAHWLTEAGKPIRALLGRLALDEVATAFEAGCGTGYTTALLARALAPEARLTAADVSAGMLALARTRLGEEPRVTWRHGDALEALGETRGLDLVISTWVLGYIPLEPFFAAAYGALRPGGVLAFIVHRDGSPREPLELFQRLAVENPAAIQRQVAFDFPRDRVHLVDALSGAGFAVGELTDGAIVFDCATARDALDHLLRSGAGTAYFNAVAPADRDGLTNRFVERLAALHAPGTGVPVAHEYFACIARKG